MHIPVLVEEVLHYLAVRPDGVFLDVTAGLGGHCGAIASRLTTGRLIATDRDAETLELARVNTAQWAERIQFQQSRFSALDRTLAQIATPVDGLLADLGVSRYQLTTAERGFGFSSDGPLDMRMDRMQPESAFDLVNYTGEKQLADLIYQFGEERRARRISRAVLRARPIRSTGHLARVIEEAVSRSGRSRLHPATRTFMALRLAVNGELEELEALLESLPRLVKPGGRVVVIAFMSLEDRRVKLGFQSLARAGRARILTRHVVVPQPGEIRDNPAARSARLRALEMCESSG